MKCILADDAEMHRKFFEQVVAEIEGNIEILGIGEDGQELCEIYSAKSAEKIDVVFCDIRMPNMDGLSALVKILGQNPQQKMVMVSSEDIDKMKRLNEAKNDQEKANADWDKKMAMLGKVAERIKSGVVEEGKINSILEGCEKLAADPIEVAKYFGAAGYLKKPYDQNKLAEMLDNLSKGSEFSVVL